MFKLGKQFSTSKRNFNKKGWTNKSEPEIKTRKLDSNKWINNEDIVNEEDVNRIKTRQLDSSKWKEKTNVEFEKEKNEYLNEIQDDIWKVVDNTLPCKKPKTQKESVILIQKIVRGWLLRQNVKYRYCDIGRTKKVLYYPKKNRKTWWEMCKEARMTYKYPEQKQSKTSKEIAQEQRLKRYNLLCERIWVHSNKTLQNRWEEIHSWVYSGKLSYDFMEEHLILKFYNNPTKRKKMYNKYKTLKNKKNPLETKIYKLIAQCYAEFL